MRGTTFCEVLNTGLIKSGFLKHFWVWVWFFFSCRAAAKTDEYIKTVQVIRQRAEVGGKS